MTREAALAAVRALHPKLRDGIWSANRYSDDEWCVEYRYRNGARKIEAYVLDSGVIEDVNGKPYRH